MKLKLSYLVTFITAVQLGSFAQAAKSLGITEGTVSYQIKTLEQFFENELFTRKVGGSQLTEEGKIVLSYAEKILNALENAKREITEIKNELRGKITIGASTIPGEHVLPQLINKFKEQNQDVDFVIKISDTLEALHRLTLGEVDMAAVGSLLLVPKDLEYKKKVIGEEELVLIVSPNSKQATKETISVNDLLKLPFIVRERGSGTRIETEKFLKEAGTEPSKLRVKLELGSTGSIITAVSEGIGVSIISETAARKVEGAGLIKIVRLQGVNSRRKLYLIRNLQKELTKPARIFWEQL